MTTIIELSEKDMAEIIAKHFSVSVDEVDITTEEKCIGYGLAEHYENVPVARVTIDNCDINTEVTIER